MACKLFLNGNSSLSASLSSPVLFFLKSPSLAGFASVFTLPSRTRPRTSKGSLESSPRTILMRTQILSQSLGPGSALNLRQVPVPLLLTEAACRVADQYSSQQAVPAPQGHGNASRPFASGTEPGLWDSISHFTS